MTRIIMSMRKMTAYRRSLFLVTICFTAMTFFYMGRNVVFPSDVPDPVAGFVPEHMETEKLYAELARLKKQLARIKLKGKECGIADHEVETTTEPVIYVVTPTYARPEQKAELTRMGNTLLLVPNLHWIIIEDAEQKTPLVIRFLKSSGISYTHLNARTPKEQKLGMMDAHWTKPRGVLQRNTALEWLHKNLEPNKQGVVYFADDDNAYDVQVFEEMRWTKKVSVWPVGLVGGLMVERPIPDQNGRVASFNAGYKPDRKFPIDMAGFAINLQLLISKPGAKFLYNVQPGMQESQFLSKLTTKQELEVKADNCTKVFVWHTRTEKPKMREEKIREKKGLKPSHFNIEV